MSQQSRTSKQQKQLFEAASRVFEHAYAPYSNYRVGSALLTAEGEIFVGCNVENGAFPATICAERAAVVSAVSQGYRDFVAIAVVTEDGGTPCGICRQVLSEFSLDMEVYIFQTDGTLIYAGTMHDLLPATFKLNRPRQPNTR
jgi:cytidine deaminase